MKSASFFYDPKASSSFSHLRARGCKTDEMRGEFLSCLCTGTYLQFALPWKSAEALYWTYNFIGLPITLALEDKQTVLQVALLTTEVHPE